MNLYFKSDIPGHQTIVEMDLDSNPYYSNLNKLRGFRYKGVRPEMITLSPLEWRDHAGRKDFHIILCMTTRPGKVFVDIMSAEDTLETPLR